MDIITSLSEIEASISKSIDELKQEEIQNPFRNLKKCIQDVGKSFSGSWLGYHAYTYYREFNIPPNNAIFSKEWGLNHILDRGAIGDWEVYNPSVVKNYILKSANLEDIDSFIDIIKSIGVKIEQDKNRLISILYSYLKNNNDNYIDEIVKKVKDLVVIDYFSFINLSSPKGTIITRDSTALSQGTKTPPHFDLYAKIQILPSYIDCGEELIRCIRNCIFYLDNQFTGLEMSSRGTNIFIGHGHSKMWLELKDFIQDRLNLPWDEFNRIPAAGITNIIRLSQLLNNSCFAFLIMTAEDEQDDGSYHARMNVIHEVGLFQGRLGFEKAIVLLEDGCKEFSNITGLGQIRFPKDRISAVFEDVRLVLEREGIIK